MLAHPLFSEQEKHYNKNIVSKKYGLVSSFKFAFNGLADAFKNEPNLRIHSLFALVALAAGFFFQLSRFEWIILIFIISWVFVMELLNTTLESMVDLVSPELHPKAKVAKDVAAAGVLISAFLSLVIAGFLFLPKILLLLE